MNLTTIYYDFLMLKGVLKLYNNVTRLYLCDQYGPFDIRLDPFYQILLNYGVIPMSIKKIITINESIKSILPKSYPRPRICLYEDEDHLAEVQNVDNQHSTLFAVFDPNVNTINVSIKEALSLSDVDVAKLLLHEYAHAVRGAKYGYASAEYLDEPECDAFACRWIKKLDDVIGEIENGRFCGWRNEEVEYLTNKYPTETKERLLKRLGRSWAAIRSKAYSLGLTRKV